jgi:hypothetical protein
LTLVRLAVNLGLPDPLRRSDHHEYRLRRIILGRWKFLYCVDFNFTILVKERKVSWFSLNKSETEIPASFLKTRYSDIPFVCFITAVLFSSYSLRYRYIITKNLATEFQSGFIILKRTADFLPEMPIVSFTQRKNINQLRIILFGALMSLSFYVLLINIWAGILIVSILFHHFWRNVYLPFLHLLR